MKMDYSIDTYLAFIEKTQIASGDDELSIYLFGGEPSLEYTMASQVVKAVRDRLGAKYKSHFVLHTNGLLLGEIPSDLAEILSLVMLSINYDKIPKYNLAQGYFKTIIENTILMKRSYGIPVIARLTATETTSLYTEVMQLHHFFDLVYWQIENSKSFDDYEAYYQTYTYEIGLLYKIWLQYFESGTMLKLAPFMAVVKFMFFHDRSDKEFSCGYGRGMVYIQTDGSCYACSDSVENKTHFIGDLENGVKLGGHSLDKYRCSKCEYRPLCMGRCARIHLEYDNNRISEYCKLNQFMFNLFLSDKNKLSEILVKYPYYENELSSRLLEFTEFTP